MKEYKPLLADCTKEEATGLCADLRRDLLANTAKTGGHLASNLGTVELMVAIHRVFDTKTDRLVFDVGHQCYVHKMLTGRGDQMDTLRQFEGLAGFPKPSESPHDAFVAGHASNSVAVAVGMAKARNMLQEDHQVIALLGDGALTGGLAYEGLANGGQISGQLLVILNDNGMSISKNVGGMAKYLANQRLKPQYLSFRRLYRRILGKSELGRKIHSVNHNLKQGIKGSLFPCSLFEQLGFVYYGPVDGHDIEELTKILRYAKESDQPILLHVRTTKGKDYTPAQENPHGFHGVAPFDPSTGKVLKSSQKESFSQRFGGTLVKLAEHNPKICALTAAMAPGTGLDSFEQSYPDRLFDVGIAEGCGVSMAGGLAAQGALPVFAVYSTFLQRAYDMLIHDVSLMDLHVIYGVDRAGLVGEDGETHHGVFDLAILSTVPHLTVLAPSTLSELEGMLTWAVEKQEKAVAIRYPRGGEGDFSGEYTGNQADLLESGTDITLVTHGIYINQVLDCGKLLKEAGFSPEIIKINQISPLDPEIVLNSVQKTGRLLVAEDVISSGSLGEKLAVALGESGTSAQVVLVNSGRDFVTHGAVGKLQEILGLSPEGLFQRCKEVLSGGTTGK